MNDECVSDGITVTFLRTSLLDAAYGKFVIRSTCHCATYRKASEKKV